MARRPMLAVATDGRPVPNEQITDLMLELLELGPNDRLLEIGTGTAYQTERWAATGCKVYSIELKPLIPADDSFDRIKLVIGDGKHGLPESAPFTAIVATCGFKDIPDPWRRQLAEGGRLVVPIGDAVIQKLTLFRKVSGEVKAERVAAYTRFVMAE